MVPFVRAVIVQAAGQGAGRVEKGVGYECRSADTAITMGLGHMSWASVVVHLSFMTVVRCAVFLSAVQLT